MAVLSARRPTGHCFCIWMFLLLLVFVQMLTSLMLFAGVFILSNDTSISPYNFCRLTDQDGELSYCRPVNGAESEITINILTTMVILGLYIPVVLVAFALLTMMLATYAKDSAALWLSMGFQGVSSLLMLTGIISFLLLNWSYVSWEHMTPWFYVCVAVQIELGIMTVQTFVSGRRLKSDWD